MQTAQEQKKRKDLYLFIFLIKLIRVNLSFFLFFPFLLDLESLRPTIVSILVDIS